MSRLSVLLLLACSLAVAGAKTSKCEDPDFTKTTLKEVGGEAFAGLFPDRRNATKFEGSDVIQIEDGNFIVVFDSLQAIGRINPGLVYSHASNEAVPTAVAQKDTYHAIVKTVTLDGTKGYDVHETCPCEQEFTSENKGFEGVAWLGTANGERLLALCEGNYCQGGDQGKTQGHGRVVVMTHNATGANNGGCLWATEQVLHLPKTVAFTDYSAISLKKAATANQYRVAVTSQEDAALWVGTLTVDGSDYNFDDGVVYDFPRNDDCDIVHCNIEGVAWLDDHNVVAVSDKMKGHGDQHFRCLTQDQSVHQFSIP